MRCIVLVLAVGLVGCKSKSDEPPDPAAAPAAQLAPARVVAGKEATVPRVEPKVGDVVTTQLSGTTKSGLVAQRDKMPSALDATIAKTRRLEVLAVEGDVVTGAKLAYPDERMELTAGKQAGRWQPLLRGHEYQATWRGGQLEVERVGAAIAGEEAKRLRRDLRALVGRPDYIARSFAGRLVKSGDVLQLPAADLAPTLSERAKVSEATVRLIDVRGDIAVFEVYLVYWAEEDALAFDIKSRSLLEVSTKTGRPIRQTSSSWLSSVKDKIAMAFVYDETAEYTYETAR